MTGIFIPIVLVIIGLVTAVAAYRGIRRGGARFYTLEREAMLRRAGFSLVATVLFFLAALGLLLLERQQLVAPPEEPAEAVQEGVAPTTLPTQNIQQFPPTSTPTATPDPAQPTPTATPVVCRGAIENTGGSGLLLRDAPSGAEIRTLPEGTLVTLLEEEPVVLNGFTWRSVRVVGGEEGWVAEDYLTIAPPCQ